jgi:hypothetical protein
MGSSSVDVGKAVKQGDEILNGSSLKYFMSVKHLIEKKNVSAFNTSSSVLLFSAII